MNDAIDIWCAAVLCAAITPIVFWSTLVMPPKRRICHLRLVK